MHLKGQYAVTPLERPLSADVDAFRFRSIPKARREAKRLARWSGDFVYIVDQHAVERSETRPYYGEIVAPPGRAPGEALGGLGDDTECRTEATPNVASPKPSEGDARGEGT